MPAARRAARGRPLVFNPLVSLGDTLVGDRGRFRPGSRPRGRSRRVDRTRSAGRISSWPTPRRTPTISPACAGSPRERVEVCFVGAEERLFRPGWQRAGAVHRPLRRQADPAARPRDDARGGARSRPRSRFRVVGSGQLEAHPRRPAGRTSSGSQWVEYERLPDELQAAGCALGIFGTSAKAARVIPNKAFQALACGTPLDHRRHARPRGSCSADGESALLVPPGDAGGARGGDPAAGRRRGAGRADREPWPRRLPGARERGRARRTVARAARGAVRRAGRLLGRDRRVRRRLRGALGAASRSLRYRPLRPREHGPGGLDDRARDPLRITDLRRRADLAARRALRPDPAAAFAPLWLVWPEPVTARSSSRRSPSRSARCRCSGSPGSTSVPSGPASASRSPTSSTRRCSGCVLDDSTRWRSRARCCCSRFWYLDEDRLVPFAAFAAVAAADEGARRARGRGMGVWYALARGRRRAGLLIAVAGTRRRAAGDRRRRPSLRATGESDFYWRYGEVGGSPGGHRRDSAHRSVDVAARRLRGPGCRLPRRARAPARGLSLLAPLTLLSPLPELAINLLSSTPTQTSIHFHYIAGDHAGLVVGGVFGAAWLARRRPRRARGSPAVIVVLAARELRLGADAGLAPHARRRGPRAPRPGRHEHDRIAKRALELDPGRRRRERVEHARRPPLRAAPVLSFPLLLDARWVAVDETRPSYVDRASRRPRPQRRSPGCGAIPRGSSSSRRTACSSSGERD